MRAMVAEGKVTDVHAARSNEAAAAGRLIAGLDAFPRAAMDDLLDVRRQLEHPLVRFRAALATVQVELAAWDEGFDREVEDLYRQQVALACSGAASAEGTRRPTDAAAAGLKRARRGRRRGPRARRGGRGRLRRPAAVVHGTPGAPLLAAGASEALQRRDIKRSAAQNSFYFLYAGDHRLAA
jgi:hypothetical protein